MRCFVHQSSDAVAVCKACGRGACHECATPVGDWIACGTRCVQSVATINDVVTRTNPRMRATHGTQGAAFLVLCFAMTIAGVIADGVGRGVLLSAAALCLLAAVRFFRLAAMYRATGANPKTAKPGQSPER